MALPPPPLHTRALLGCLNAQKGLLQRLPCAVIAASQNKSLRYRYAIWR